MINKKIQIKNTSHSALVQEQLFKNGCTWLSQKDQSYSSPKFLKADFLYSDTRGLLSFSKSGGIDLFDADNRKEILFLQPKQRELLDYIETQWLNRKVLKEILHTGFYSKTDQTSLNMLRNKYSGKLKNFNKNDN